MTVKIGFGYDTHRFIDGEFIVIGGEKIQFIKGVDAHSDGDVLLHAICDALLGAAGLGDIGKQFSDTDSKFKNIESSKLLKIVINKITDTGFVVGNIDSTVVLERPKIAHFIPRMRENICKLVNLEENKVNIKATTNEGMGFIGKCEGIAAYAVVTIIQYSSK